MNLLILVPCIICFILVIRGRLETAFLSVYLPVLLLLPELYAIRLPHFPTMSISEAAVIPLGIVCLYRMALKGLPSLLDVLVILFMAAITVSEVFREPVMNDGIFLSIKFVVSMLLPYAVGRMMIEPGLRLATVRRIVILILLLGFPGVYEWRLGLNIYAPIGEKLLGIPFGSGVQIRGGHGRMAASFGDAEIGGIAFVMTACLNAWLVYLWKKGLFKNPGKLFSFLEKYHAGGLILLGFVFLTQSRGPMLAAALAYFILQIPRFKNTKLASGVIAGIILIGSIGAYQYYNKYANVEDPYAVGEQQMSAAYRYIMNRDYAPIAQEGGFLGWGSINYPVIPGMHSIDNQFLLTHLSHGELGFILLILIAIETMRSLAVRSWRLNSLEDRAFAFSMLAAMAAFWFSIMTVYMGEQLPQVAFLFIGWTQSIQAGATTTETAQQDLSPPKFAFGRVFR